MRDLINEDKEHERVISSASDQLSDTDWKELGALAGRVVKDSFAGNDVRLNNLLVRGIDATILGFEPCDNSDSAGMVTSGLGVRNLSSGFIVKIADLLRLDCTTSPLLLFGWLDCIGTSRMLIGWPGRKGQYVVKGLAGS